MANTINKIITLPKGTVAVIEKLSAAQRMRVKNYIERLVIEHAQDNVLETISKKKSK